MTDEEIGRLAEAIAGALKPHLERSEELRRAADSIGRRLIEEAGRIERERNGLIEVREERDGAEQADATGGEGAGEVVVRKIEPEVRAKTGIVRLNIGGASTHVEVKGTTEEIGKARQAVEFKARVDDEGEWGGSSAGANADVRLSLVVQRCRLKAESCRLFAERRAAEPGSEAEREAVARIKRLLAEGKALEGCFLWALFQDRPKPDDATLERIAKCYEAQASAAELCRRVDELHPGERCEEMAEAMALLAEANSALRVAMRASWLKDDDRDQADVHAWLRRQTSMRRVYIARHMTVDDPADPTGAEDLLRSIAALAGRVENEAGRLRDVSATLNKIRYHAGQIVKKGHGESEVDRRRIGDAVAHLMEVGLAASDPRIGGSIGRAAAAGWPVDEEPAASAALREALARAAAGEREREEREGEEGEQKGDRWSERVRRVRDLLRGRRLVIVGGEPMPHAIERITDAFDLEETDWVELTEHGTGAPMRAPIFRPETALVVVIIKLAGHLHAESARAWSAEAGKPWVYLTGGYNPEAMANAILEQASGQLGARA
ncbi:MAG: hypothetical protein KF768_03760 [Phycisphaeraceae bacterium]|nr:hypothetical protein [Phycisphaeraceae bacterium]